MSQQIVTAPGEIAHLTAGSYQTSYLWIRDTLVLDLKTAKWMTIFHRTIGENVGRFRWHIYSDQEPPYGSAQWEDELSYSTIEQAENIRLALDISDYPNLRFGVDVYNLRDVCISKIIWGQEAYGGGEG